MIFVIARIKLQPGGREALAAPLVALQRETQTEPGCHRYDVLSMSADADAITIVEEWTDMEALAAHMGMAHMLAWRTAAGPHVAARAVQVIHADRVDDALPQPATQG